MRRAPFVIAASAGLLGAAGVAAAAAAAHLAGGKLLETAAMFLMVHSAALIGIAALAERAPRRAALSFIAGAALLVVGLTLFCGDFAMRALASRPLFQMAAPSGGTMLIVGWLVAAVGGSIAAMARVPDSGR
jgi:uncharacterized membrane protein YgdD (TMEM256/DUF423 family)